MLRSQRTIKRKDVTSNEERYYLSSASPNQYSSLQWIDLIRGHWGGVENRNHWRRDALFGEDKSRTRKPNALANMALVRNVLLSVLSHHLPSYSIPCAHELLASNPARCLSLIQAR